MSDTPAISPATPVTASSAERQAAGEARRKIIPRTAQGAWAPAAGRPDPVQALLEANAGRVTDLLPLKWGRMAASPFGFFRGAAPLMALDLAGHPTTGLAVQLCGDAHVRNLGAYAAPDGHLVFDLNDFDETLPAAPWEWDVKRLATSLVLVNREAGGRDKDAAAAVRAFTRCYRESLGRFAAMRTLELIAYEVHRYSKVASVRAILQRAERATPLKSLAKLTVPEPAGEPRFHDQPPLLRHVPDEEAAGVFAALGPYRATLGLDRQQALDAYRRDYAVLLLGNGPGDPLFLQVKEERPSAWASSVSGRADGAHQGQRVAEGQHRCQTVTDPFVGWTTMAGGDYLVRQLADHKASVDPADLKDDVLREYALVCGETLATAHARTGDAVALAAYCGAGDRLDAAMADFALLYAEQTVRDHAALVAAVQAGRLTAIASP